jgi:hypothetical protein
MSLPDTNSTHCVASAPPAYDVMTSSVANATEAKTTQVRQRVFHFQQPPQQAQAPSHPVAQLSGDQLYKRECCCLGCGCIMGIALGVLWGMNQFCDCSSLSGTSPNSSLSGPLPNMHGRIPIGRPYP